MSVKYKCHKCGILETEKVHKLRKPFDINKVWESVGLGVGMVSDHGAVVIGLLGGSVILFKENTLFILFIVAIFSAFFGILHALESPDYEYKCKSCSSITSPIYNAYSDDDSDY